MALNQDELIKLYRGLAHKYDLTTNLYWLVGFRMTAFRKAAVAAFELRAGETVVELGCGTGLNFPLLQQAVGPKGKIIGVDLTDAMLAKARERVNRHGWTNVELVQSDVAKYVFQSPVDGILSTFTMEFVSEYDDLIRRCAAALSPGKSLVAGDLKHPGGRLSRLAPFLSGLARPYGTTIDLADRKPWESFSAYLDDTRLKEFYFGCAYLASGRKR